ncbi:MAG: DUF47 family protein [Armatimonadetes bacterium]|nr:DUF47 family protein [Armatimonadota bacterium]
MKRFRFMPTEENFFELFDEIAQVLVDAAVCLQDLITNYEDVEDKARNLREMEKRVDSATDGICERLNISFVTPIDREDIHGLATKMDDVLDYIEASSDRMKLYGVEKPREEAGEIADLLVEGTKLIRQAVHALADFRDIRSVLDPCIEINKIENQADQVQRRALKRLFAEEDRPLEVAKWQEIFDRLETATDRCEDVANILESIVVKNA